jgi:hypothetical protein
MKLIHVAGCAWIPQLLHERDGAGLCSLDVLRPFDSLTHFFSRGVVLVITWQLVIQQQSFILLHNLVS